MFLQILFNFFIGLLGGSIFEFIYRSRQAGEIVRPKFINIQMYALTAAFLGVLYFLNISQTFELVLIFVFPTAVEFLTGYLYFRAKGFYPWDYSDEKFNFMGIICPQFSLFWFILALGYYYFILPYTIF